MMARTGHAPTARGSAWSATPSWAPRTRRPGAPQAGSSTCRSTPDGGARRPRRRPRVAAAAAELGWAEHRDRLARLLSRATTSTWSTSAPRATSHAEIADRRAGGRQARAVREAAGQHRRGGRGDGRPRPSGRSSTACARWCGFNYRRVPAMALARAAGRGGPARRDPARAGAVPAGLDRRPGVPAGLAAAEGPGRLRRAGRHRRAHRRPRPVRHRRSASPGVRPDGDVRQGAAAAARPSAGLAATAAPTRRARSPSTTRRCSSPGSAAGRSASFEATRFATGRKNALRIEVNGSAGSLAFDFEAMNELQFYDGAGRRARPPASGGSWSPSRATPTSVPGGRPATASATSTGSPTRSSTW